jgi:hypothetical protein
MSSRAQKHHSRRATHFSLVLSLYLPHTHTLPPKPSSPPHTHTHTHLQGIEEGDTFTFNAEFSSKFKRIKVPLISAKEVVPVGGGVGGGEGGGGLEEGLPGAVEEERRHHVEATLVRIMKSRKTLSHNELVAETTRQLAVRFTPSPQVPIHLYTYTPIHLCTY